MAAHPVPEVDRVRPFRPSPCPLPALLLAALAAAPAQGQAVPRDRYLGYLPLDLPPVVRQTEASAAFTLYGDAKAPGYRDAEPRDGVDDARGRRLTALAARFGPLMVLNTSQAPLDFRRILQEHGGTILNVDTWNLLGQPATLVRTETVDLDEVADAPCGPNASWSPSGDCLLLDLLRRYDPDGADYASLLPRAEAPDSRSYQVMFFDFPGDSPETWRSAYENAFSGLMPRQYRDWLKTYVHPFIHARADGGYEFILQYYFFYPVNDGGNNHEGDWEHINVSVSPREALGRPLTADEIRGILSADADDDAGPGGPLVISYVDYYFHHQVYRMDYVQPAAWAPVDQWKQQLRTLPAERRGAREIWKLIRNNAWWDREETIPNTHPVCYVGADNKGLDQLLAPPGGRNRDSHGTYPYPGLYKDIGPGGATEQINAALDVKEYWERIGGDLAAAVPPRLEHGAAVPYLTADRLELLPDWERVAPLLRAEPAVRRDWCWLVLPVRFGYPATESPFAGVVGNADTGNLSPLGPSCQPHWNRPGTAGGSQAYEPHAFETMFPLGLQDTFVNSWGYLNLTLPILGALPPLDLVWRVGALPVRALLTRNDPVFFPADEIPSRFLGLTAGSRTLDFNDDTAALMLNGDAGKWLIAELLVLEPDGLASSRARAEGTTAWWWQVNLYLGKRFSTQNTLLHSRSRLLYEAVGSSGTVHLVESRLHLWEVAGSFRYDLSTSAFRPYVKLGYGRTWYRSEDGSLDGVRLPVPATPWVHQPSFKKLKDLLPNTWHAGIGLELLVIRSVAPGLRGLDLSLVTEVDFTRGKLGLDDWVRVAGSGDLSGGLIKDLSLKRWDWSVGLNLGF